MADYGPEDSKTQLKRISALLPKNKPEELYQNLTALSIALVMGMESYLRKFDSSVALPLLMEVAEQFMTHNDQGDMEVLTFRAVSLILEHVPSSYDDAQGLHKNFVKLASTAAHKALCEEWSYSDANNKLLLEECLRVIRFIGRDDPTGSMLRYTLVGDLLTLCSWDDAIMSRLALETLVTLASKVVLPTEIQKPAAPISGIFSIFKSSSSKHKGSSTTSRSSSGARRELASPLNADNPIVVIVENVLAPFLHSLVEQYVSTIEAVPEVWVMLELALQCLCGLMQRALLCCRAATAHTLVSTDLPAHVFRLIKYLNGNVSLDAAVRAERLLFCETVLSIIMDCRRSLMLSVLLSSDAQRFFRTILEDTNEEITTLLDDPFPRGGMAARSTQRRDKDHITSIAAVRLLLLACPSVPPEAFGPKPKAVLPVHEWLWEDELRHANRLVEEQALVLETAFTRLSRTTSIDVHRKALSVDLQAMTMARSFQGGRRNIFRKFVPFVYHFADEQSLRPLHAVKETGPDALESTTKSSGSSSKRKGDNQCILNTSVSVPEDHLSLPETYLDSLCSFATHASGQMARQLAVCACAAMLQMFLISGAAARVKAQLRKRMVNLCEMLREALISADKATKAVALTMVQWLLSHKMAEGCQFPITALRCGLVEELDTLSNTTPVVAERESRQTRTAYLAEKAGALSQSIFERLRVDNGASLASSNRDGPLSPESKHGGGSASHRRAPRTPVALSPETSQLRQSVDALRALGAQNGVHAGAVAQFVRALEDSHDTTAHEFSQMGVANSLMTFLFNGRTMDAVLGHSVVYQSGASGSTLGRLSDSAVGPAACPSVRVLEESPWTVMLTGGLHMAPLLRRAADAARLQSFVNEAVKSPQALQKLITLLSAALSQQGDYPLVESLVTRERVLCKTPLQAVAALTQVSPMVNLCGRDNGVTDFSKTHHATERATTSGFDTGSGTRTGTNGAASSPATAAPSTSSGAHGGTPSATAGAAPSVTETAAAKNPRNYCLQGHPLKHLTVYARPCTCDYCFSPVTRGYCCRLCNIDICSRCYPRYRGNPSLITTLTALEAAPKNRAHLMACVGDIERFFRAGSSSTKGTFTAPTSQSSLPHTTRFVEKVRLSLQRLVQAVQDERDNTTVSTSNEPAGAHADPNSLRAKQERKSSTADVGTLFDPAEVAVAGKLLNDEALLQHCVYTVLASHYTRGVMPGNRSIASTDDGTPTTTTTGAEAPSTTTLSSEEAAVADRMVRDSVDERYLLYRDAVGYCHYQDTFLSLLYRKAFHEGNTEVLIQLENCLVRLEGSSGPISAASTMSSPMAVTASVAKARGSVSANSVGSVNRSLVLTPLEGHASSLLGSATNVSACRGGTHPAAASSASATLPASNEFEGNSVRGSQSFIFHHFAHDSAERCVCGRYDRNHFSTKAHDALSFSAPVLSQRTDILLLILLHDALVQNGALRPSTAPASDLQGGAAAATASSGMELWFVSMAMTNAVVKSLGASALRVSLLPMQFALPRWTTFVLREARFLIPRAVRERVSRFMAYGARRSLIAHMRIFRQYRDERHISITNSEWARLSNHKFSVDRDRFIDDAFRTLCKASDARFPISFEFKGDVGVGQGPTAQFYTRVALELSVAVRQLWRNTTLAEDGATDTARQLIVPPPEGLYPRPGALVEPSRAHPMPRGGEVRRGFLASITNDGVGIISLADTTTPVCDFVQRQRAVAKLFYLVGAAVGRAFMDEQVLPLQLSPALAHFITTGYPPSCAEMEQFLFTSVAPEAERPIDLYDLPMRAVRMVDTSVADSLASLEQLDPDSLASLELPFTLPGNDDHELIPSGASVFVNRTNLRQYQQRVVSALLFDSVALPLRFLLRGCHDVLPGDALSLLDASELMPLLCGDGRDANTPLWSLQEIKSVLVGDHGYQNDSLQLDMLARVLATRLTPAEQRSFLLFCTGCPRLPLGGVRALGAITVVRRANAFALAQSLLAAQERMKESAAGNDDEGAGPPPPPEDLNDVPDAAAGGGGSGAATPASAGKRDSMKRSKREDGAAAAVPRKTASDVGEDDVMSPNEGGSVLSTDANAPLPSTVAVLSEVDGTNSSLHTDMTPRRAASSASGFRQLSALGGDEPMDLRMLPESEWALPSVNTCFRYLKLPPYPTEEMLYTKLLLSITQSGESFELS